jgi:hypothetical protein
MASIKIDQAPTGVQNDFEAAATHLLPCNPVQKKRADHAGGKRGSADISDATGGKCEFLEKKLAKFFPRSLFVSTRIFRRKSRG